ncbi:hypothetical protein P7K49_026137 [Saguinus oedipus]|uniref:Uncharacterized protein n=1 Tax=Saguinus oedipus TaxID=9490 RepID=A0ABQ9UKQ0_SAGOE|nr:hypothetical protein P7K49_026137 [Saguinus oedipus]
MALLSPTSSPQSHRNHSGCAIFTLTSRNGAPITHVLTTVTLASQAVPSSPSPAGMVLPSPTSSPQSHWHHRLCHLHSHQQEWCSHHPRPHHSHIGITGCAIFTLTSRNGAPVTHVLTTVTLASQAVPSSPSPAGMVLPSPTYSPQSHWHHSGCTIFTLTSRNGAPVTHVLTTVTLASQAAPSSLSPAGMVLPSPTSSPQSHWHHRLHHLHSHQQEWCSRHPRPHHSHIGITGCAIFTLTSRDGAPVTHVLTTVTSASQAVPSSLSPAGMVLPSPTYSPQSHRRHSGCAIFTLTSRNGTTVTHVLTTVTSASQAVPSSLSPVGMLLPSPTSSQQSH